MIGVGSAGVRRMGRTVTSLRPTQAEDASARLQQQVRCGVPVMIPGAWELPDHRPIVRSIESGAPMLLSHDAGPGADRERLEHAERAGARRANGEHRIERFLRRCGATSFVPPTPRWSDVEQRSTSVQMSRTRAVTTPGGGENHDWRSCPVPAPSSRRLPARG